MEVNGMVQFKEQEHQYHAEVCILNDKKVIIYLFYSLLKKLLNLEINYL